MDYQQSPDDIRREMALARAALARDARAALVDARTLVDWRHHFHVHPWLFCGCAAAVGFLLVPHREHSKSVQYVEPADSQPRGDQPHTKGLAATALGLAATFMAKQSLNFATRRGMDWLEMHRAQRRETAADQLHTGGSGS
jgi:hypothetical protein